MEKQATGISIGKNIAYIALFTAVTVVCSWIHIPTPVPFTMQTFALFLAVCTLGAKKGWIVACAYLLLGLVGVPVFSGFQGGGGALFGTTGGYLIGYFVGGGVMCLLDVLPFLKGKQGIILSCGLLVYYLCGVLWYMLVFVQGAVGLGAAMLTCVLPFVLPDVAKLILALFLGKRLKRRIK
ncbi:MAG: biotin transporter BioY [Clostridia bacterium]|nr:biotin transporter BioY [Clostridia bacterium]